MVKQASLFPWNFSRYEYRKERSGVLKRSTKYRKTSGNYYCIWKQVVPAQNVKRGCLSIWDAARVRRTPSDDTGTRLIWTKRLFPCGK